MVGDLYIGLELDLIKNALMKFSPLTFIIKAYYRDTKGNLKRLVSEHVGLCWLPDNYLVIF